MLKTVSSITNAIGALNFKGTWDANANSPALTSSVGTKGDYYVVGTAGSTNLNGISNWGIGDWAAFNGSVWQRVEGGANLNGVDLSVSGTSTLSGLTASTGLALNVNKQIVSVIAPAFAAKATAVQTVNNTTWTKLEFDSEAGTGFDTNSNFDTSTYRFTPTVAGYYQINGTGYAYPAATGAINLAIYLNGAGYTANVSAPNANQGPGLQVSALMYLNGSTDYVEIYIYQSSGGALTCGGNDFSGVLVRSA